MVECVCVVVDDDFGEWEERINTNILFNKWNDKWNRMRVLMRCRTVHKRQLQGVRFYVKMNRRNSWSTHEMRASQSKWFTTQNCATNVNKCFSDSLEWIFYLQAKMMLCGAHRKPTANYKKNNNAQNYGWSIDSPLLSATSATSRCFSMAAFFSRSPWYATFEIIFEFCLIRSVSGSSATWIVRYPPRFLHLVMLCANAPPNKMIYVAHKLKFM